MAGYSVSAIGSWAYNVGLSVYVFDSTHSAAWVGAVTVGRLLPPVLFGSYGGVLAERFERIRLMLVLDLACTVLMGALTLVAAVHGPALAAIVIGGVNSLLTMTYQPAVAATTPQLVGEDDLAAANTLFSSVSNLAVAVGPAVGALLLVIGNPEVAFAANALTFLWSAVFVSQIGTRSARVDVSGGGSVNALRQMLVGVQAIISSRTATVLASYSVAASFVYGVDTVLLLVISERRLGTGPNGYSYLLAGLGVGGLVGTAIVKWVSGRPRLTVPIIVAMAVFCAPTLAFLGVRQPVAAFFIVVVRGAGTIVVDVLAMTALQRSLPKDKLARVFGAFFTFALLGILLGALVTPQIIDTAGLTTAIWVEGGLLPVLCVAGVPWLRRMDDENIATLAELEPRIALLQQATILAESSRASLEALAKASIMQFYGTGQDVVVEGAEADALYIIERGEMAVHARSGGEDREVARLGAGDYFGEIGLVNRVPRTATVTATLPSRVLRVDGAAFLEVLSSGLAAPSLLEGAQGRLALTQALLASPRRMAGPAGTPRA